MQKPSERPADSNVIHVDFRAGRADNWFLGMAAQCEAQAETATPRMAAKLRRIADTYRAKADRG